MNRERMQKRKRLFFSFASSLFLTRHKTGVFPKGTDFPRVLQVRCVFLWDMLTAATPSCTHLLLMEKKMSVCFLDEVFSQKERTDGTRLPEGATEQELASRDIYHDIGYITNAMG